MIFLKQQFFDKKTQREKRMMRLWLCVVQ